jgi:Zn-dependent protease
VSSSTSGLQVTCKNCSAPLSPGATVCSSCRTLVHGDQMEQLAAVARATEARGDLEQARQQWLAVLPLLPSDSKQAEWIRGHVDELQKTVYEVHRPKDPNAQTKWAKRLGPLAPLAVILAKFKGFFFAFKFLFSFAAFIGLYWSLWGAKFGIGFALLIFCHEMGHFIEVKRRGLPAEMPVFLPGLGAYVKWQGMGVTLETRAAISLAGPLAGFFSSALCGLIYFNTHDPIWAALAKTGAWLNALNLIPIWVLDGAGAAMPLNRVEKVMVVATAIGLGYAVDEKVFYFVAGGMLVNMLFMGVARRPAVQPLFGTASGQQPGPQAYMSSTGEEHSGSQMIAAYFIAVLTALGGVLYLLRGYANRP